MDKKIYPPPPPKGVAVGILGGQKIKSPGHELSRKSIQFGLNPGGGCSKGRGGGWGSKFQKFGKFHELFRKSITIFLTKGGRSGNFRGSKNQKSGKCHELPRKVITTN